MFNRAFEKTEKVFRRKELQESVSNSKISKNWPGKKFVKFPFNKKALAIFSV